MDLVSRMCDSLTTSGSKNCVILRENELAEICHLQGAFFLSYRLQANSNLLILVPVFYQIVARINCMRLVLLKTVNVVENVACL